MNIKFASIDIDSDFSLCVEFRRDSYFCSFGTYIGYEDSIIGYEQRMRKRSDDESSFCFHLWCDDEIVGQLEFRTFSDLPETGYVNLVYVVPKYRGLGVAKRAQSFILNTLIINNCKNAILSVSRTNHRAINHYKRFGWKYFKPNPKHDITDFYMCELGT